MKKLLAVFLVLLPCAAVLLASLGAEAFFFSPGGTGGSGGSGDMSASDYVTGGKIKTATGGTGADTSATTGFVYILSGTWTFDNVGTFLTRLGTGTPSASNYLRGDGSWQVVSGSGDVVGPASATDGYFAYFDGATGKLLKNGQSSVNPAFSTINIVGANALNLGTAGTYAGQARFKSAGNANNYFPIIAPTAFTDNVGWILPTGAPGGTNYLLNTDADGTMGYTDPASFAPSTSTSTATDWNKWDGGSTGLVAATGRTSLGLGTLSLLDNGTMTNTKYCIWTAGTGIVCNSTPAGGITDLVQDTTPQLGGTLDTNGNSIDNVTPIVLNYVKGFTSDAQTQINGKAATNQTMNIGTTAVAINRASAALVLTGITSIDGTSAGLTAAYTDWNASSGGAFIQNKPTLGTISTQASNNVAITGGTINGTTIGGSTPAAGTFTTVTADSYSSSALDNNHYVGVGNTADPTGANLAAGRGWFNNTSNLLKWRNGDNSATLSFYPTGTMTDTKTCIYTAGTGIVCNTTPATYAPTADPVFTGSVQLPNGANPTTDAAGEIAVDTSAGAGAGVRVYAHSTYGATTLPLLQTKCTTIDNAIATSDYPLEKFQYAITIRAVHLYQVGADNVIGQLDECTGTNGVCSSVTAVDSSDIVGTNGAEVNDDGTLSNPGIAAGNRILWRTTSVGGTNTYTQVCFDYTVDAVN